ncbi:MAG: type IV secretory system conjugative DNA transfer family protein [Anaerovoracaceae bacterium]
MKKQNEDIRSIRKRLMGFTRHFRNKKIIAITAAALFVLTMMLTSYVINMIVQLPKTLNSAVIQMENPDVESVNIESPNMSIKYAFIFQYKYLWVYVLMTLLLAAILIKAYIRFHTAFEDLNIGQKGTTRWATREEIKEQYKKVPIKCNNPNWNTDYKGKGGLIVASDEDYHYIDDSAVNNMFIGTTRSGKGECEVIPMIDVYSRAEEKSSLIITDMKLELAPCCIPMLEKRGYECHILNLIEPEMSMGYNPLALIVEAYKDNDIDTADLLCVTFAYSIYNPEDNATGDTYWDDNSTLLLNAVILALCEDSLREDEYENYFIEKRADSINNKAKENAIKKLPPHLRIILEIQDEIRQMPSGLSNDVEDILLHFKDKGETRYTEEQIREAFNGEEIEIDYKKVEFERTNRNEKNINMYSVVKIISELSSRPIDEEGNKTYLDLYFENRPEGNPAKMKFAAIGSAGGAKTKGSIYSNTIKSLRVFNSVSLAKMTAENTVDLLKVGFGPKPVAIFIGIPHYDSSNHFLATLFISQLNFILSKYAATAPGGHLNREVVFHLDEIGNLPPIEGMETKITVGLGTWIKFNLFVQAYSQIIDKYPKAAKTILGNCANHIYILTNELETAKDFSELVGSETITVLSRMGSKYGLKKEYTESYDERALINHNELMELNEGETIVKRVAKRTDLKRNAIKPRPIFNEGENRLKYRWEYLDDQFPKDRFLYNSPGIEKTIREINRTRKAEGKEDIKPKFVEGYDAESISDINLKTQSFNVTKYIDECEMLESDAREYLTEKDFDFLASLGLDPKEILEPGDSTEEEVDSISCQEMLIELRKDIDSFESEATESQYFELKNKFTKKFKTEIEENYEH